jgi:type IV secretion system protein VirB5
MSTLRTQLAALTLAASAAAAPVHAQIPVTDILANINWLQQLLDNITDVEIQLDSLQSQYQQYAALTGDRGYGRLLRNTGLDSYLPANTLELIDASQRGMDGLTDAARALRGDAPNICNTLMPSARAVCEYQGASPYQNSALLRQAMGQQRQRLVQIRGLLDAVSGATDPASMAQLSARIEGEMAAANQADGQIKALQALAEQDERIAAAKRREAMLENLNRTGGLRINADPAAF